MCAGGKAAGGDTGLSRGGFPACPRCGRVRGLLRGCSGTTCPAATVSARLKPRPELSPGRAFAPKCHVGGALGGAGNPCLSPREDVRTARGLRVPVRGLQTGHGRWYRSRAGTFSLCFTSSIVHAGSSIKEDPDTTRLAPGYRTQPKILQTPKWQRIARPGAAPSLHGQPHAGFTGGWHQLGPVPYWDGNMRPVQRRLAGVVLEPPRTWKHLPAALLRARGRSPARGGRSRPWNPPPLAAASGLRCPVGRELGTAGS